MYTLVIWISCFVSYISVTASRWLGAGPWRPRQWQDGAGRARPRLGHGARLDGALRTNGGKFWGKFGKMVIRGGLIVINGGEW